MHVGRARSFDETAVLAGAMDAFRRRGFAGVSIKKLEATTGLTSGSIYHAFGDKESLYQAAFHHYIDAVIRRRLTTYAGEDAGLDGVERLFLSLLSAPEGDRDGCLLTNAAVEFGSSPSIASDGVEAGFAVLERGIREVVEREVDESRVDLTVARLLLLYQGLLVLMRAGHDVSACELVIRDEFNRLRSTES